MTILNFREEFVNVTGDCPQVDRPNKRGIGPASRTTTQKILVAPMTIRIS